MPTCHNCKSEWTWKQTVKSLFRLKCPYCGKNNMNQQHLEKEPP